MLGNAKLFEIVNMIVKKADGFVINSSDEK
jgi:hypothetical protein